MPSKFILTHNSWRSMISRCYNPAYPGYNKYGAKGIIVCKRWHDYKNFVADMGKRTSSTLSLDRINNNGNYEPLNCRWGTRSQQSLNRNHPQGELAGIYWDSDRCRWRAQAQHRWLYTGYDFFEAVCARKSWEATCRAAQI